MSKRVSIRDLCLGILIGACISASVAYAAAAFTLRNSSGTEVGTASNPLYIQF